MNNKQAKAMYRVSDVSGIVLGGIGTALLCVAEAGQGAAGDLLHEDVPDLLDGQAGRHDACGHPGQEELRVEGDQAEQTRDNEDEDDNTRDCQFWCVIPDTPVLVS